jgi:hydroxyacylglutathione hydrolase
VRVGLDNVAGFVTDVKSSGLPTTSLPRIDIDEAKRRWSAEEAIVLDVRQRGEFAEGHVPRAMHISSGRLRAKIADVPKGKQLLVMCAGGDRSVSAASVLSSLGFTDVINVSGGFDEWSSQGLPTESGNVAAAT